MPARPLAALALTLLAAPAPADEIKRLHVLLVVDTTDPNLKDSVERDRARMTDLFRDTLPAECYTLTEVVGNLTRGQVLAKAKALRPGPADGVVFYYAGHGGQDAKTSKLFFATGWTPQNKKLDPLFRDEVRAALTATNPPLVVMLTDCCSNPIDLPGRKSGKRDTDRAAGEIPSKVGAVNMRRLFFDARGLVDITAASDDVSWGTPIRGGFFTSTFARVVTGAIEPGGPAPNPIESWKELVTLVSHETPVLHEKQVKRGLVPPPEGRAKFQTPKAYALGRMVAAAVNKAGGEQGLPTKAYAVVALWTTEAAGIRFKYRWDGGDGAWIPIALKPKQPQVVYVELPPGADLPSLEVDLSDSVGKKFDAIRYEGAGPPPPRTGKLYNVTLPK